MEVVAIDQKGGELVRGINAMHLHTIREGVIFVDISMDNDSCLKAFHTPHFCDRAGVRGIRGLRPKTEYYFRLESLERGERRESEAVSNVTMSIEEDVEQLTRLLLSIFLFFFLSFFLSFFLFLSLPLPSTHTHTLSLSLTHSLTLSLTHSLTHSHTHTDNHRS